MKRVIAAFLCAIIYSNAFPQALVTKSDTLRKDALNVYMDASDYIKKEIPYINYVRDIKDAGVYIISTYENTGSGGTKYSFYLVGQNQFAGMRDTISYSSTPDDTQETIRLNQVKVLKMGLMRYIARTPLSKYMSINFSEPLSETVSSDKWNSWVFRASLNGYAQAQQTYNSHNFYGNFSANKVTKDWKINLNFGLSHAKQTYIIDTVKYISTYDTKSLNGLIARSLNDHWSYGVSAMIGSSSYSNLNLTTKLMPGVEYDIFPYSSSTRKLLTLLYKIGPNYVIYNDSTIYDKTRELLWLENLSATYVVIEKWGTINLGILYSNYLHDWTKNNLSFNTYLELRIAKGLRLYLGAQASLVHDQLGLVKGGATEEEVLLQRKELATQYQYFFQFGFSYTFGSIYNNVVNPRFNDTGGMYYMY